MSNTPPVGYRSPSTGARSNIMDLMKAVTALNVFNTQLTNLKAIMVSSGGLRNSFTRVAQSVRYAATGWRQTSAAEEMAARGFATMSSFKKSFAARGGFSATQRMASAGIQYGAAPSRMIGSSTIQAYTPFRARMAAVGSMISNPDARSAMNLQSWGALNQMPGGPTRGEKISYGLRRAGDVAAGAGAIPLRGAMGSLGLAGKVATAPLNIMGKMAGGMATMAGRMAGVSPAKMAQMGETMKSIGGGITQMGMMAVLDVVMQLLNALNPFKPLVEALVTIFGVYGAILSTAFTPLIEKLFEVMLSETVMGLVQQLADQFLVLVTMMLPVVDILTPLGASLFPILGAVLQSMQPIVLLLVGVLATLVPIITQMLNLFLALWNLLAPILLPVIGAIVMALSFLAQILGGVLTIAITLVVGLISGLANGWTDFTTIMANGWNQIKAGFVGLINGFISILNSAANGINNLTGAEADDWYYMGTIDPVQLATGGIATRPTFAMIGEAGPEAVIPLNSDGSPKGNFGRGGTTINVYGDLTEEMAYKMQKEIWLRSQVI